MPHNDPAQYTVLGWVKILLCFSSKITHGEERTIFLLRILVIWTSWPKALTWFIVVSPRFILFFRRTSMRPSWRFLFFVRTSAHIFCVGSHEYEKISPLTSLSFKSTMMFLRVLVEIYLGEATASKVDSESVNNFTGILPWTSPYERSSSCLAANTESSTILRRFNVSASLLLWQTLLIYLVFQNIRDAWVIEEFGKKRKIPPIAL